MKAGNILMVVLLTCRSGCLGPRDTTTQAEQRRLRQSLCHMAGTPRHQLRPSRGTGGLQQKPRDMQRDVRLMQSDNTPKLFSKYFKCADTSISR